MSDPIEAMARAVAIKRMGTDENWQLYVADQTAALAALRETHHLVPKDQEPVGWIRLGGDGVRLLYSTYKKPETDTPLYALEKRYA